MASDDQSGAPAPEPVCTRCGKWREHAEHDYCLTPGSHEYEPATAGQLRSELISALYALRSPLLTKRRLGTADIADKAAIARIEKRIDVLELTEDEDLIGHPDPAPPSRAPAPPSVVTCPACGHVSPEGHVHACKAAWPVPCEVCGDPSEHPYRDGHAYRPEPSAPPAGAGEPGLDPNRAWEADFERRAAVQPAAGRPQLCEVCNGGANDRTCDGLRYARCVDIRDAYDAGHAAAQHALETLGRLYNDRVRERDEARAERDAQERECQRTAKQSAANRAELAALRAAARRLLDTPPNGEPVQVDFDALRSLLGEAEGTER